VKVYVEPDLVSRDWPKFVASTNPLHAALPVRQPDGSTRFVLCENTDDWPNIGSSCSLYAGDGSVIKVDFPRQGPSHQPAVGNLDGQPGDEIVVPDEFQIKIFSSTFSLIRTISNNTTTRFFGNYPVQLVDLDNDGKLEIVTLSFGMISFDDDPSTAADYLYVYQADGSLYSANYPALIPQEGFGTSVFVAIDLNGDKRKEILVSALEPSGTSALIAFNTSGTNFSGWARRSFETWIASMTASDLDNNGISEIILQEWPGPMIRVLDATGAVRAGWPVKVSATLARIAIGDLDRDARNEIVVAGDDTLTVLRGNGSVFSSSWPLSGVFGAAVIADINNDGFPEIVVGSTSATYDTRLTAYRRDRSVLKQWFLFGTMGRYPGAAVPTVGEFTRDGKSDVMVNIPLIEVLGPDSTIVSGSSLAYLTSGTTYNPVASDWPVNLHDAQDSNVLPSSNAGSCVLANANGGWVNTALSAAQTGRFTFVFDATPSASRINSAMGLSNGPQTAPQGIAAMVRFNPAGRIDARNGGGFTASTITYGANLKYRFRLVVNVTAHVYSAYVTGPSGVETTIGTNLAFRTEQNAVTTLNNWAAVADVGSSVVCNGQIQ
jgi:hypothetical protein